MWHALGMQHQNFALVKSFLHDLSKALHRRLGFDGEPMVRLLTAQKGQLIASSTLQRPTRRHCICQVPPQVLWPCQTSDCAVQARQT